MEAHFPKCQSDEAESATGRAKWEDYRVEVFMRAISPLIVKPMRFVRRRRSQIIA